MVATQLATLAAPLSQSADFDIVRMTQTNVLFLGGDRYSTPKVLDEIRPYLDEPVMHWRAGERLRLPVVPRRGTLILDGLDGMSLDDQCRLLEWLDGVERSTRVVSTAAESLRGRIDAGSFFEELYYRLNTVCIDVDADDSGN
jgi:hypothetical protein